MITAVVGAQYGSEGKGAVVARVAQHYEVHVRCGGPQAGHTHYYQGQKVVNRSVPCGWVNRKAKLIIGAGATVDFALLRRELDEVHQYDPTVESRLHIDTRCWPVLEHDRTMEEGMAENIGSTMEGVGAARIRRIQRRPDQTPEHTAWAQASKYGLTDRMTDTLPLLDHWRNAGSDILLEGTQGSGLSLWHGPWPYATSHDTNAAQLAADAGIPPQCVTDVILVARTMPIRVGGNSGPLRDEVTWDQLIADRGLQIVPERTTVTGRVRRIGAWDDELFARAVRLNAPTALAITFADYLDSSVAGITDSYALYQSEPVAAFLHRIQVRHGLLPSLVGTGPNSMVVM